MRLEVVTHDGAKLRETDVTEVVATTELGEVGIRLRHRNFIAGLWPGRFFYEKASVRYLFAADTGFLQVCDDVVRVIVETCHAPHEIDVDAERARLAEAEAALRQPTETSSDERFAQLQLRLARARTRLEVAQAAPNPPPPRQSSADPEASATSSSRNQCSTYE